MGAEENIDGQLNALQIYAVPPEYMLPVWPKVKTDIEFIKAKQNELWLVEDVYHEIRTGQSNLLVGTVSGQYAGCLVYRVELCRFTQKKKMFIWIAAMTDGEFSNALEHIKNVARGTEAKVIQFESPRRGWEKRAKLLKCTYEIEV